ncbi:MAG: insulinase family protein, partial [Alphaproteobacteria bacterium]
MLSAAARLSAALAVTLALSAVLALRAGPAAAANGDVSHFTLENGLELVVIEDHRAPMVHHMVWYRVGAADEPPGRSGIAHFLEHLMFKGTDEVGPAEFSRLVAATGGSDNAFTSYDYTAYFQRVPADALDLVMRLEADRMRDLRLDPKDVVTERDVILSERGQRIENDPAALLREEAGAAFWRNHPYGVPVIGWRHEVARLTREDALAFYRRFYAPNNAIVVVSGDVSPERALELARKWYGPLAPTPGLGPRLRPQEPPHRAEMRVSLADARVGSPWVSLRWLAPVRRPGDQRKAAALVLAAELLGGSQQTSVLGRDLVLGKRKLLDVQAWADVLSLDPSQFGIFALP